MLRCLYHAYALVAEQARRAAEKFGHRHEIGVENRNEIWGIGELRHMPQGVIDVAGLGVLVVRARQIPAAELAGKLFEPVTPSVVQNPDAVVGIVHSRGADDCALQNRRFLVVGANEYVDQRSLPSGKPPPVDFDLRRSIGRAAEKHQCQCTRRKRYSLDEEEHGSHGEVGGPADGRHRGCHAPSKIADHEQQCD